MQIWRMYSFKNWWHSHSAVCLETDPAVRNHRGNGVTVSPAPAPVAPPISTNSLITTSLRARYIYQWNEEQPTQFTEEACFREPKREEHPSQDDKSIGSGAAGKGKLSPSPWLSGEFFLFVFYFSVRRRDGPGSGGFVGLILVTLRDGNVRAREWSARVKPIYTTGLTLNLITKIKKDPLNNLSLRPANVDTGWPGPARNCWNYRGVACPPGQFAPAWGRPGTRRRWARCRPPGPRKKN